MEGKCQRKWQQTLKTRARKKKWRFLSRGNEKRKQKRAKRRAFLYNQNGKHDCGNTQGKGCEGKRGEGTPESCATAVNR